MVYVIEHAPNDWTAEQKEEIQRIAYFKWIDAGKPEGQDLHFWVEAENDYFFGPTVEVDMNSGYYAWNGQMHKSEIKLDPESFNPRKGIMTKYGKKLLEEGAKYYKKITIPVDFTV